MKSSLFERVCKVEGLPDFLTAPDTRRGFKGRVPGRIEPAPSDDPNSFHRCMRSVLIVGQCFSLMPIRGISGGEASSLRFRWFHWSLFYSSLVIFGCLFMLGVAVKKTFDKGFEFEDSSLFFMSMAIGANLLFIQLARNWPQLSLEWERAEVSMKHHGYPRNLAIKLKVYMVVILIGSTVEHLLANLKRALTSTRCTDGTLTDWLQYCFVTGYSQVFNYFSYSHWKGIALFLIHLVATYIWNYMDMFVIILSIALVERFRLISAKLRKVRGKRMPESFWKQTREDYNTLSYLCRNLDAAISKLVLLSFTSNIYFICLQLYNSIRPLNDPVDIVYFYYSFGYLLLRSVSVSLFAASIYDETKEPKAVLYSVPSESFNDEVQRFLQQVTFDDVVLTGLNFFSITRSLLLTVAGTIVTYEIFLIQFNNINADTEIHVEYNFTVSCYAGYKDH